MKAKNIIKVVESNFGWFHDKEELLSVGNLAYCEAKRDFDPEKNVNFSTYAYICILGKIKNYLRKEYERYDNEISIENLYYLEDKNSKIYYDLYNKIDLLPNNLQKIIKLRLSDYTFQEISDKLEENLSTIYKRYQKSINILKGL